MKAKYRLPIASALLILAGWAWAANYDVDYFGAQNLAAGTATVGNLTASGTVTAAAFSGPIGGVTVGGIAKYDANDYYTSTSTSIDAMAAYEANDYVTSVSVGTIAAYEANDYVTSVSVGTIAPYGSNDYLTSGGRTLVFATGTLDNGTSSATITVADTDSNDFVMVNNITDADVSIQRATPGTGNVVVETDGLAATTATIQLMVFQD